MSKVNTPSSHLDTLLIKDGPNKGLPEMNEQGRITSFFEFWPVWVMYIPVVFYWAYLSIRYRSASLPLLANPNVFLAGMIGESKVDLLDSGQQYAQNYILPYTALVTTGSTPNDTLTAERQCAAKNLAYPLVVKPDLGCRGAGVQVVKNREQLQHYIDAFPHGEKLVIQKLSRYKAEAGVFYARHPDEPCGKVVSLTLKYRACVVGDGKRTVEQLILDDARASKLADVYKKRLKDIWSSVPLLHEQVPLVFAGSHCRGSIFKDGCEYISDDLSHKIDAIMKDFPEFHYGRLDIKFESIASFMHAQHFEIIEVNGASSEQTHIWDSQTSFKSAISALLWQYKTLFSIGAAHRAKGRTPPSVYLLLKVWLKDLRQGNTYPPTH